MPVIKVSDGCPLDAPKVECVYDPCTFATCEGDGSALCIPSYCGECNAVFYSKPGELADCGTYRIAEATDRSASGAWAHISYPVSV